MAKLPNTHGGGAGTNRTGLLFEQTTDLATAIRQSGKYKVEGNVVLEGSRPVAFLYPKDLLYTCFLKPKGIDYRKYISQQLKPDEALLVGRTLYIIEKKFQKGWGSVQEKLQTCEFKKRQYTKLLSPLGIRVEYYYFLCDWFKRPEYRDVLEYVREKGCKYFFDELPLEEIGL